MLFFSMINWGFGMESDNDVEGGFMIKIIKNMKSIEEIEKKNNKEKV